MLVEVKVEKIKSVKVNKHIIRLPRVKSKGKRKPENDLVVTGYDVIVYFGEDYGDSSIVYTFTTMKVADEFASMIESFIKFAKNSENERNSNTDTVFTTEPIKLGFNSEEVHIIEKGRSIATIYYRSYYDRDLKEIRKAS